MPKQAHLGGASWKPLLAGIGDDTMIKIVDELCQRPPNLHFWEGSWNTGGFSTEVLQRFADLVVGELPERPTVVETGAGLSTLLFLALGAHEVLSVCLDEDGELEKRIREEALGRGMSSSSLRFVHGRSEDLLPNLTLELSADLALMDGGHGWPTCFVDFYYLNRCLKQGGLLVVDDLQLYSVAELVRFLEMQPHFVEARRLGPKTVAFKKVWQHEALPDFGAQPYILERSQGL